MTEEHRRENIALELAKAARELRHARLLIEADGFDGAVSHAYYHAFHCARALVLMEGMEAKAHSGLVHLVNLHFVRTGRLTPEQARVLSRLHAEREDADYDATAVFTRAMADKAIEEAQEFGRVARETLAREGYA